MNELKNIPIPLKLLSVILIIWVAMTIAVSASMPEREIGFFGLLLAGMPSFIVVFILDIFSPLLFIYTVFKKLNWGALFGLAYNGIFILNCLISLALFQDKFGNGIYFPLTVSSMFFLIIFMNRKYFD